MKTALIKFFNKTKILPLMILLGCALLILKVQSIFFEFENKGVFITEAVAKASDKESSPGSSGDIGEEIEKEDHNESNSTISESEKFDILSLTPERVEIYRKLFERRKKLEEEEKALDRKRSALLAIERRINDKLQTLNNIKDHVQKLVDRRENIVNEATSRLVATYEKMKPQAAANILEGLDIETLIDLISHFKESKASEILANMSLQKARIVTMELMNRRKVDGFDADIPHLEPVQ